MQPQLQSEDRGEVSLKLVTPFTFGQTDGRTTLRMRPSVAQGIAGHISGITDLAFLSLILIECALWAGGVEYVGNPVQLLSARMTIGHLFVLAFCWIIWRTIFYYCGLYSWQHIQSAKGVVGRVMVATGVSSLVAGQVIASQWHHGHFVRISIYFWIASMCCALTSRAVIGSFQLYVRPHLRRTRNAVIVGGGERAARACEELRVHSEWDYRVLGFVDSTVVEDPELNEKILGRISDLEDILMREVVDEVIVALSIKSHYSAIERVIAVCERVGVQVQYSEDLFDLSWSGHCHVGDAEQRRIVLKMVREDYRHRIKRVLDIAGALIGLILCLPLFIVVGILIKATSKGPIVFKQERYGLGKRIFRIYKFRTMVENAEAAQAALEQMNENSGPVFKIFKDPRVTPIGNFLRKTSIDELPQLFNILKGEMSFVGPRPLNMRDVGRFSESWLMRRFSVKPGLTCLWQVSGRSNVSFDRWIALDLHYIDHWSLQMDFKILAMTIPAVLRGTGAA
jgi:exopolysaccharide biosynthesis polyprenyl glycosylphosphotransferase